MSKKWIFWVVVGVVIVGVLGFFVWWLMIKPEVVLQSEVSGVKWRRENNVSRELVKSLGKINFWREGVVYGFPVVEGKAKIKKLEIRLVGEN